MAVHFNGLPLQFASIESRQWFADPKGQGKLWSASMRGIIILLQVFFNRSSRLAGSADTANIERLRMSIRVVNRRRHLPTDSLVSTDGHMYTNV